MGQILPRRWNFDTLHCKASGNRARKAMSAVYSYRNASIGSIYAALRAG